MNAEKELNEIYNFNHSLRFKLNIIQKQLEKSGVVVDNSLLAILYEMVGNFKTEMLSFRFHGFQTKKFTFDVTVTPRTKIDTNLLNVLEETNGDILEDDEGDYCCFNLIKLENYFVELDFYHES